LVLTIRGQIEQIAFEYSQRVLGGFTVVFYDMTTLYFEAEREDELRRIGYSKDGKCQHPQIMLGLLVGLDGYPVSYDVFEGNTFEGNTFEGHTLLTVLANVERKFGIGKPLVVADSALLSGKNIRDLTKKKYCYIIGGRVKNEAVAIQNKILDIAPQLQHQDCYEIEKSDGSRLIVNYSSKRAKKDALNRKKGISRLEKSIASGKLTKTAINGRGYNRFLTLDGNVMVSINAEKVAADSTWDGLKGYITNSTLSPQDVVAHYRQLWKIERAFRISKTDLRVRPIYHRKRDRIEAHICVAFVAYTVFKELERQLKIQEINVSPQKALEEMATIYQISLTLPQSHIKHTQFARLSEIQRKLLKITQK
jgi:transposase